MVSCPHCGNESLGLIKIWTIPSKKTTEHRERKRFVGILQCPNCRSKFRSPTLLPTKIDSTASIKNLVEKIKSIKGELMQTLTNLREKIRTLENERANLLTEIAELRRAAESKANALESEVGMLREEVRYLRNFLGYSDE